MLPQAAATTKCAHTTREEAFVRLLTRMYHFMSLDVGRISERLVATGEGTFEWLLSRMNAKVAFECGCFREGFIASLIRTHMRLLTGVLLHMSLE